MKRTKEWWACLTPDERSELVLLERAEKKSSQVGFSPYMPDDCGECTRCGRPTTAYDLCPECLHKLIELSKKPERILAEREGDYGNEKL